MIDRADIAKHWNTNLEIIYCQGCDWAFLAPRGKTGLSCPHCHKNKLLPVENPEPNIIYTASPELIVPFSLSSQDIENAFVVFSRGIPFPPDGLNLRSLRSHLFPIYLPMWLVDANILANWHAEAGFDYEVISHQESFDEDGKGWTTHEVKETRIRWERRAGQIHRPYLNTRVPAMDDADLITHQLGAFSVTNAPGYTPDLLGQSFIRLPDHSPDEAWKEATLAFQNAAAAQCEKACSANHLREFHWQARFDKLNWTLIILPVYTSFFRDDDGAPHNVMIHGQTGKVTGMKCASLRRAQAASLFLLIAGIVLCMVGIFAGQFARSYYLMEVISTFLILVGIASGIGALAPVMIAWDFNRKQSRKKS